MAHSFLLPFLARYAKRDPNGFGAMIDAQYKLHSGRKQIYPSRKKNPHIREGQTSKENRKK